MDLTPLHTTDPAALTLPELVRLYEDLAPKGGSPYKTRVEVELASRLRPGKGFVDGALYRFAADDQGDLVKFPKPTTAAINRMVHHKPTKWPRKPRASEAAARFAGARKGDRKIAATDPDR